MHTYFNNLLFSASEGKPSEMQALGGFMIEDFFAYLMNKEKQNG
jgi:hypothetical protein